MNKLLIFSVVFVALYSSLLATEASAENSDALKKISFDPTSELPISNPPHPVTSDLIDVDTKSTPVQKDGKFFIFASGIPPLYSFEPVTGGGFSYRNKTYSIDATVYSASPYINFFSISASQVLYFESFNTPRPYTSIGLGVGVPLVWFYPTAICPSIPVRFGVEYKGFFLDLGGSLLLYIENPDKWYEGLSVQPVPLPEIRFGAGF